MIRLVLAVVISACLMSASLAILSSTIPNTYAMKNAFRGAAMVKMGTESSKIFAQISSSLSKEKILLLPILAIVAIVSAYFLSPFRGYSGTGFASSALSMGNLSAFITTYQSCSFGNYVLNVTFGTSLSPTFVYNASQNQGCTNTFSCYNVTVNTLSNSRSNISMNGTDFKATGVLGGTNTLGIGNVSWYSNWSANAESAGSGGSDTNGTLLYVKSFPNYNLSAVLNRARPIWNWTTIGSTVYWRFWLRVPEGQVAGAYWGNFTVMCETGE